MNNVLMLVRQNDTGGPRHGGWRTYRNFKLYLNGYLLETFRDDSPSTGYSSDKYLDDMIFSQIHTLEKALRCKCLIAKVRDFDPKAGLPEPRRDTNQRRKQVGVNATYRS